MQTNSHEAKSIKWSQNITHKIRAGPLWNPTIVQLSEKCSCLNDLNFSTVFFAFICRAKLMQACLLTMSNLYLYVTLHWIAQREICPVYTEYRFRDCGTTSTLPKWLSPYFAALILVTEFTEMNIWMHWDRSICWIWIDVTFIRRCFMSVSDLKAESWTREEERW